MVTGIQWSHETFKTALPHGNQAPWIKRQFFRVFQKQKNTNKHEEQKKSLKATTSSHVLHWEYHSKKSFIIGKELICLLLRTFVVNFYKCLQFKKWHVFLFRHYWWNRQVEELTHDMRHSCYRGLMCHCRTQSRLTSLPMLTIRQQCLFLCLYFSGGCAWGYVMCTCVANQCHSCTIQVFEWSHIRKMELVILCWYMHRWNRCQDLTAFWFHY